MSTSTRCSAWWGSRDRASRSPCSAGARLAAAFREDHGARPNSAARAHRREPQAAPYVRGANIAMILRIRSPRLNPSQGRGSTLGGVARPDSELSRSVRRRERSSFSTRSASAGRAPCAQYPHEFRAGCGQRAMIAIAIANHPTCLIADEPTTALDVTIQAQISSCSRRSSARPGTRSCSSPTTRGDRESSPVACRLMYAGRA